MQVDHVVVVDNHSKNFSKISQLCGSSDNCHFIRLKYNSGVQALNVAIDYAINILNANWILILDQDAILKPNAIEIAFTRLYEIRRDLKIGILHLGGMNVKQKTASGLLVVEKLPTFSGCIISAKVLRDEGISIRSDFFLDQADFDLFENIKRSGYRLIMTKEKLIDNQVGVQHPWLKKLRSKPIISLLIASSYEPLWRYYYIVRNSTTLLLEGKLPLSFYIRQLISWGFSSALVEGVKKTIKTLMIGLAHGIFKRLGYLDPKFLNVD